MGIHIKVFVKGHICWFSCFIFREYWTFLVACVELHTASTYTSVSQMVLSETPGFQSKDATHNIILQYKKEGKYRV
jgi:hypothetical protein